MDTMVKKAVSLMLAVSVFTTPCVALAAHHHHHHYDDYPRHHRRYHHRGHRSLHKGDYIAVATGVIIGAILANRKKKKKPIRKIFRMGYFLFLNIFCYIIM